MGMSSGGGGDDINSNINVTPLVDVVLVLLIIFMVVTPMLQRGKDVQLPVTGNPAEEKSDEENEILLSVTKDGNIYVDSARVSIEELVQVMGEAYARNPGKKIVLKGDRRLTFGEVKDVMLVMNEAGFTNVAVMADKAGGADSSGH
jgi:biopolymer transport protein TolR